MESKELQQALTDLKSGLEKTIDEKLQPYVKANEENQKAIDNLLSDAKSRKRGFSAENKTFGEALAEEIANKESEFKHANDRDFKLRLQLKTVNTMTTSNDITGDPQLSYNQRQGLIPTQKINFRDLIPSTFSATGQYVTYRENAVNGAFDLQSSEGNKKPQVEYSFTNVKTVEKYISGTVDFSKQMMTNLPWLQGTLSRLLLRDFYKKENSYIYSQVAAGATGGGVPTESDDVKALIDVLMTLQDADFNTSAIIVKNAEKGRLLKLLYANQRYVGSGAVVGTPGGSIQIAGVPVIGASWATDHKAMVIDNDYIERVEAQALAVEFSFENKDNFEKNLITARVECFEELNMLRTDGHAYIDLGLNS